MAAGERLTAGKDLSLDGGMQFRACEVDPLFGARGDWFILGREVMACWGERWPRSLQLVWSDRGEEFPRDAGDPRWSLHQPLLFSR